MTGIGEATAHSNIALVKYWGKRSDTPAELNLPAVGSFSLTLDALTTKTRVTFDPAMEADQLLVNDKPEDSARVSAFLDLVRRRAGVGHRARVETHNDFPTAAGLASSASGFAALALAASRAAGLDLSPPALSTLARRGSGSAARSIYGGFVAMDRGSAADGSDAIARPFAAREHWPLSVVVAITAEARKPVSSSTGMRETARSSPFYPAFVESHAADLAEAQLAVELRDFDRLATVTEASCLKMHAAMMTAAPPLLYWLPGSIAAMDEVRRLRDSGLPVCFTMDAGPQVKAVCEPTVAEQVAAALAEVPGVQRVLVSGLGQGVR